MAAGEEKKTGVLLLNMGGPDSIEAVRPFLRNIFSDRMIINLPLQPLTARVIAMARSPKIVDRYRMIGGKSPILEQTLAQAEALAAELRNRGESGYKVYVGMRYWHPFIDEALARAANDGVNELVVLPLFPQYSRATTGSCFNQVDAFAPKYLPGIPVRKIRSWPSQAWYLDALAAKVGEAMRKTAAAVPEIEVIFSAHALPQRFVDEGDPYPSEVKETIAGILTRLGSLSWRLTYQSRSGPVKWMEPQTEAVIEQLASQGKKHLVVVPISFVSDHIETLHELGIEYRRRAEEMGVESFVVSDALGTDERFIKALASLVVEAADEDVDQAAGLTERMSK